MSCCLFNLIPEMAINDGDFDPPRYRLFHMRATTIPSLRLPEGPSTVRCIMPFRCRVPRLSQTSPAPRLPFDHRTCGASWDSGVRGCVTHRIHRRNVEEGLTFISATLEIDPIIEFDLFIQYFEPGDGLC
jgi:hypothetical protein